MFKKSLYFASITLALVLFFGLNQSAQAADCDVTVNFVARDPGGDFIPGARVDIYKQEIDANGYHKPGAHLSSATASTNLGTATMKFKLVEGQSSTLAAKVKTVTSDVGAFYFYDLPVACGDNNFEQTLSSFTFVIRDANGNLQPNTAFYLYTQKYNADNKPVKEKKDLVASLNTGVTGSVRVYVPQGSLRSIDGRGPDYYVIEASRPNAVFLKYDIQAFDGAVSGLEYFLSAAQVSFTGFDGSVFPAKTNVEVYKQILDIDNQKQKGTKVGSFNTDDNGSGTFEYPEGLYVLGVKDKKGQYQYFWDVEIVDGQLKEYDFSPSGNWNPGTGACSDALTFTLRVSDYDNRPAKGVKYELYEQGRDIDNRPIPSGNAVNKGVIDLSGKAIITFKPDPVKDYALKIYDKNANVGEFWIYNAVKFVCGYDRTLSTTLSTLKVILREPSGQLKKNSKFSLYTQQYDADGKPISDRKELVADLQTGEDGEVSVFVAPDHSYDQNKRGLYAISLIGANNSNFDIYNIKIEKFQNTKIDYALSDLNLIFKNVAGQPITVREVKLYEQLSSSDGKSLGKVLAKGKTDNSGRVNFAYQAGRYAATILDDLNQENTFWDVVIKERKSNKISVQANLTQVSLNNSQVVNLASNLSLHVYALVSTGAKNYVKGKDLGAIKVQGAQTGRFSLAPGPYLISYTEPKTKTEYGEVIWSRNGQSQKMIINLKASSRVTADKVFVLSTPASYVTPAPILSGGSPGTSNSSASSSVSSTALANRLKGYILLQVEAQGQAWYVNPATGKRRYLANGQAAYNLMRSLGIGAKNTDLNKIFPGFDPKFYTGLEDADGDILPDVLEVSLGTDRNDSDTDNDSFLDGQELSGGFNPLGAGKIKFDAKFSAAQKGKILLQVEKNGEAWYVYPKNNRRYYLADGNSAYNIMRYLGLGVKNSDLNLIAEE